MTDADRSYRGPAGDFARRVDQHVASVLRARRAETGISQVRLAEAIGLTFRQVQKYERGMNRISIGKLVAIARVLDVPVSAFFEGIAADGPFPPEPLVSSERRRVETEIKQSVARLSDEARAAVHTIVRSLAGDQP